MEALLTEGLIFKGKERDTKPLLAKLSLGQHRVLSYVHAALFPDPGVVLLTVDGVREAVPVPNQ